MYNPVATVVHRATNNTGKYNILVMDTHERYQQNLAKTGHNFYSLFDPAQKRWDNRFAEVPENYHLIENPVGDGIQLQNGVFFDFVLSQNKFGQYQTLSNIARRIKAPLVSVEHTLPIDTWSPERVAAVKHMRGDFNVFLSNFSADAWGSDEHTIIHNSVDTSFFYPDYSIKQNGCALSVVNEWKDRDYFCGYKLWENIVRSDIPYRVCGNNPGWTVPVDGMEELRNEYRSAKVFLNTSLRSTCPTTLLEAAACGIPIVTTATTMIPEIIENGHNGFISNDIDELRGYVKLLLEDDKLARELGENARQTMINKFSIDSFCSKWNGLFDEVSNFVYKE